MSQTLTRERVVAEGWVDRYLRRELDGGDCEEFELFYLDCPETLRELQVTRALMQSPHWPARDRSPGLLERFGAWLAAPRLGPALAGGFAILLVAPLLATIAVYENREGVGRAAAANDVVLGVPLVRSAGADFRPVARGGLPESGSALVLRLELDYSEHPLHRVVVERWPEQQSVAEVRDVRLQAPGDLVVSLPAGSLRDGDYRALVYPQVGTDADAIAGFDFSLR